MRTDPFALGSICIDGVTYAHDVVITRGRVRKRKKRPSKPFRDPSAIPHSPSRKTSHGTAGARWWYGHGRRSSLMDEVKAEAARREVALVTVPTREAIRALQDEPKRMNAILHVPADRFPSEPEGHGTPSPVASRDGERKSATACPLAVFAVLAGRPCLLGPPTERLTSYNAARNPETASHQRW